MADPICTCESLPEPPDESCPIHGIDSPPDRSSSVPSGERPTLDENAVRRVHSALANVARDDLSERDLLGLAESVVAQLREPREWTCPHGVTYSGPDDFISGARNAHDELAARLEQVEATLDRWIALGEKYRCTRCGCVSDHLNRGTVFAHALGCPNEVEPNEAPIEVVYVPVAERDRALALLSVAESALEAIEGATKDNGGHDGPQEPGACSACDALRLARSALARIREGEG